jgi:hypothetical protein
VPGFEKFILNRTDPGDEKSIPGVGTVQQALRAWYFPVPVRENYFEV